MQKIIFSFALIVLLSASACGNRQGVAADGTPSPTPSASATATAEPVASVTADINPTLDTNDAVLAEVNKLEEEGVLTAVAVRESFPVQITATGPQDVIDKLKKMASGDTVTAQNTGLMITNIAKKTNGMNQESENLVAKTAAEWKALWIKHHGSEEEMPDVDFSKEVVAAVFMGQRSTAGYMIEMTAAELKDDVLTITYKESVPPEGGFTAQVITAPVHLAKIQVKPAQFSSTSFVKK
jgi:hypothetical protein